MLGVVEYGFVNTIFRRPLWDREVNLRSGQICVYVFGSKLIIEAEFDYYVSTWVCNLLFVLSINVLLLSLVLLLLAFSIFKIEKAISNLL